MGRLGKMFFFQIQNAKKLKVWNFFYHKFLQKNNGVQKVDSE